MIAGMARQIRTIELIFGPASRAPRLWRTAIGLGAAPWKMVLVTLGNRQREKGIDPAVSET